MDSGLRVLLSTVLCLSQSLIISSSCKFHKPQPALFTKNVPVPTISVSLLKLIKSKFSGFALWVHQIRADYFSRHFYLILSSFKENIWIIQNCKLKIKLQKNQNHQKWFWSLHLLWSLKNAKKKSYLKCLFALFISSSGYWFLNSYLLILTNFFLQAKLMPWNMLF